MWICWKWPPLVAVFCEVHKSGMFGFTPVRTLNSQGVDPTCHLQCPTHTFVTRGFWASIRSRDVGFKPSSSTIEVSQRGRPA